MGVRKTESRIPANFKPDDLGQAVVAADGRCVLIAFVTAPIVVNRENVYVVFITDTALASSVKLFEWSFTEDPGTSTIKTSDFGQIAYIPTAEGYLNLTVRMLDAGSSEQASLSLTQQVGTLNATLEAMIADAVNKPGPGIGNTDVWRELVNDHNPYYLDVTLKTPETGEGFKKFLFSKIYDEILEQKSDKRYYQLDQVATSLNTEETDFISAIAPGLGVAGVRLSLVAMILPPMSIPFTELPEPNAKNAVFDEQLRQKLATINESDRIDLFNLVRFPKSNIIVCGKLLEALRDKFFSGVNFDDILTKMSGKMGDWIILNYNKGPLHRN